jgi:hypothetical protein
MDLEVPQYGSKWEALTWKVLDNLGSKNMVQSQELIAMRSLFLDNTPYSFVGKREVNLLRLIKETSDVPSHVKMATAGLKYFEEELAEFEKNKAI